MKSGRRCVSGKQLSTDNRLTPALAAGVSACPDTLRIKHKRGMSMLQREVTDLVRQIPLVDTHEHLWEESDRCVRSRLDLPHADFGLLMYHYTDSDLQVSGLSVEDYRRLIGPDLSPTEKWDLVAPYYARCRNTGYQLCIRETVRALYDEDDVRADNCERISQKLAEGERPGFYRHLLRDIANIEYCQVNSQQLLPFCETQYPDLLCQDLGLVTFFTECWNFQKLAALAGKTVTTLNEWHEAMDYFFDRFGPRAIAVKSQGAYTRRLNYAKVDENEAAPLAVRYLQEQSAITTGELHTLQDHLFHYCVDKAREYHLPVKLHTGYFAGSGWMPLERPHHNAQDLCPILNAHKDTKFVLMHIDYPYQDEIIALAKHYPNAYVDMCWAWIINPQACVRFLKEFIMAAPACKLTVFGGDYCAVEMVVGHAAIARRGIVQAFTELIQEGWVTESEAPDLIERIMRGNAHELYDYDRVQRNWKPG